MSTIPKHSTEPFYFSLLQKLLHYDPASGRLTWLPRPQRMFADVRACSVWNANNAGQEAFTALCANGYRSGTIFGKTYRGHRIAMALYIGRWLRDDEFVDHLNGVRHDNRAANMRIVDRKTNMRNIATPKSSTSGRVGVTFSRDKNLWRVSMFGRHIGYSKSFDDAVAMRVAAETLHGFTFRASTKATEERKQ